MNLMAMYRQLINQLINTISARSFALLCAGISTTMLIAAETNPGYAPSFRVETHLFEGTNAQPSSQHLVLFDAGVVYDIPLESATVITVFDIPRGRVLLLHKDTLVKTSIATDTLVQMAAQVRATAMQSKNAAALGLDAKIFSGPEPDSYVVQFGDSKYATTSERVSDPQIAAEYASFTAWASRLNLARHVGSPPFARISLAEEMAAKQQLPRKLTLEVRRGFKTRVLRSENLVVERLSEVDRKQITDVGGMIATFNDVAFAEFPGE